MYQVDTTLEPPSLQAGWKKNESNDRVMAGNVQTCQLRLNQLHQPKSGFTLRKLPSFPVVICCMLSINKQLKKLPIFVCHWLTQSEVSSSVVDWPSHLFLAQHTDLWQHILPWTDLLVSLTFVVLSGAFGTWVLSSELNASGLSHFNQCTCVLIWDVDAYRNHAVSAIVLL